MKKRTEKKDATPAQISLAWMLRKYPNVVPIPGSKNKGRIKALFAGSRKQSIISSKDQMKGRYSMEMISACRDWYNGDPILEEYHDHEWCKIHHDDDFEFEMLCLEGASVGLSWQIIMHKRAAYRAAFHQFKIDACAAMTDEELEALCADPGIIRNRNKIFSVRKNAQIVQKIQDEFGSFDAYLWHFSEGRQIDGHWKTPADIPTVSDVSIAMSKDMKKRGIGFVGPVITYSFLQSIGIVNDHLADCEYR